MTPEIVTIGAFGWTEERFFSALSASGADVFCDLRRRRGVRGSEYAFVNSKRLQSKLGLLGIRYFHFLDLAPTPAVRACQHVADAEDGVRKRDRSILAGTFIAAYRQACMTAFSAPVFLSQVTPFNKIALFCVEKMPGACHRSIVAEELAKSAGARVEHLLP